MSITETTNKDFERFVKSLNEEQKQFMFFMVQQLDSLVDELSLSENALVILSNHITDDPEKAESLVIETKNMVMNDLRSVQ